MLLRTPAPPQKNHKIRTQTLILQYKSIKNNKENTIKLGQPTLSGKAQQYAVEVKTTRYGLNALTFFAGNHPWGNNSSPAMVFLFWYFTHDQIATFRQKT